MALRRSLLRFCLNSGCPAKMRMITNGHADVTSTIAIIDFETTGLDPHSGDRPTEVAVVFVRDQQIVDRFQRLINPGRHIPSFITSLTGITNAMVRSAPPVEIVMAELHGKIRDIPLIAHNASFDRKFLDNELAKIRRRRRQEFICSVRVARRVLRGASNYKLETLVKHVGLSFPSNAHRALADAEITARLWIAMEQRLQQSFNLPHVPLDLFTRLQSVTIANADKYIRNYARALQSPASRTHPTKTPNAGRKPTTQVSVPQRPKVAKENQAPDPTDSPEIIKCITCGYSISLVDFDGIRWLKCPCCGFNTPQRHN